MIDRRFRDINCDKSKSKSKSKSKNKYKSKFVRKRCHKGPGRDWNWNKPIRGNQNKLQFHEFAPNFGTANRQRNVRIEAKQICRDRSLWYDDYDYI